MLACTQHMQLERWARHCSIVRTEQFMLPYKGRHSLIGKQRIRAAEVEPL